MTREAANPLTDANWGKSTAGNNRRVHVVQQTLEAHFRTQCGVLVPRRPQTTQRALPDCKRCK